MKTWQEHTENLMNVENKWSDNLDPSKVGVQ